MGDSIVSFVGQQMLYAAPTIFVCLAGVVAGFVFMRRMPSAALTCIVGCTLLGLAALFTVVVQAWLIRSQAGATALGQSMTLVALAGTVARTIGLGAIVASVFMGRGKASGA